MNVSGLIIPKYSENAHFLLFECFNFTSAHCEDIHLIVVTLFKFSTYFIKQNNIEVIDVQNKLHQKAQADGVGRMWQQKMTSNNNYERDKGIHN